MKNIIKNSSQTLCHQVITILAEYHDPITGMPLEQHHHYEGLVIADGRLSLALNITHDRQQEYKDLCNKIEQRLRKLPFINDVLIVITAARSTQGSAESQPAKMSTLPQRIDFPNIRHIIAVASGKGGVGKSTIAVNLAVGLQQSGLRVGLLDADLYGPSVPRMLGLTERPIVDNNKKLTPLIHSSGLKCMSMGLMVDDTTPVIWRGPIVQSSFIQLIKETNWEQLDALVIDLPPGTGDIHLTLIQRIPVTGVVIVSTPQDIALLDAQRAIAMFKKMDTPILGLVENMSTFICGHCQQETDIFNRGGTKQTCLTFNIALLAEIPLHGDIRRSGDDGSPVIAHNRLNDLETMSIYDQNNNNRAAFQVMVTAVYERLLATSYNEETL